MEILRWFEGIRTPSLDWFFSTVTKFGEESLFILIGFIIFWCINKKHGYYILFVGFLGVLINQFLKILFRVPRPWVLDKDFTIVESARAEATGYSFPSGHTQVSVGAYGAIARATSKLWIRVLSVILCILVPISRMYLGVHTPLDVGVSVILALLLVFLMYPIHNFTTKRKNGMRAILGSMLLLSVYYLLFAELYPFPSDIDMINYNDALANAYKILGSILGIWLGYEIDAKYINFETSAVWWAQVLKLILGAIPVLLIKGILKQPLAEAFSFAGDGIRYFLITLFACGIWPMTFKYFQKMGKGNK